MFLICDVFCGAGGIAMGYHLALKEKGIEHQIWGIDKEDMSDEYPFNFIQGDFQDFPLEFYQKFDWFHFSPPCQAYSGMTKVVIQREQNRGNSDYDESKLEEKYPKLIGPVRKLGLKLKKPFVIENVKGAPIRHDLELSGEMFKGLKSLRTRFFEIHGFKVYPLKKQYPLKKNMFICTKQQNKEETLEASKKALGISWMKSFKTLGEAIPPAYSQYIMEEYLKNHKTLLDFI